MNTLLKQTASHEVNFTLQCRSVNGYEGSVLLDALTDIVVIDKNLQLPSLDKVPKHVWERSDIRPPSPSSFLPSSLSTSSWILHSVLVVLRNLSFVSANLRPLAFHPRVLPLLITSLYLSGDHSDELLSVVHTLTNLHPILDVTGQRLMCDSVFLNNDKGLAKLGFGGIRLAKRLDNDTLHDDALAWEISGPQIQRIWCLFPALRHVLTDPDTPRPVLISAIEFVQELLTHKETSSRVPTMKELFQEVPYDVLVRLVDLLWIPRGGPDALDYLNPLTNVVSRVSTLKLMMGYDATIDSEVRDRALDFLVMLAGLDEKVPQKLVKTGTQLFDALLPILKSKTGRNDAPALAVSLLKIMARFQDTNDGFLYVQERILTLASTDNQVAELALGHLYRNDSDNKKEKEETKKTGDDNEIASNTRDPLNGSGSPATAAGVGSSSSNSGGGGSSRSGGKSTDQRKRKAS